MENILDLAKNIKLVVFDVDGVLTDGSLYLTDEEIEIKAFYSQDGIGMKLLIKSGIIVAAITARQSNTVAARMRSLGIEHVYQGNLDKIPAYEDLLTKLNLTDKQVAYVGDDLPDLALIRRARLGIAPINAQPFIRNHADWVTTQPGGKGAVREVCDLIMKAQGTLDYMYNSFLQ